MRKERLHKVLIFIVAYNAQKTLKKVLDQIPQEMFDKYETEALVIDDASQDSTFEVGLSQAQSWTNCPITILKNSKNQGYGGNQKLGYEYAIKNSFDIVALLHGDGQYAPEMLPALVKTIAEDKSDAVFGSRMMIPGDALKGGMPLYKFMGNKILSTCQNFILKTKLSEFHSGYRVYSTKVLDKIPFQYNTNDFHFDTDIIIQLIMSNMRIREVPIPTYYGNEICYVNGIKYAKNVLLSTIRYRLHLMGLKYHRKFDVGDNHLAYDIKLGYKSSHTLAISSIPEGSRVIDIGCGQGLVAKELLKKSCYVAGLDQYPVNLENVSEYIEWDLNRDTLPVKIYDYDYILMLDIIEHLRNPEDFMDMLRRGAKLHRPTIIFTTANVAFFVIRIMLLLGQFNYGKRGILDLTHSRLFTFTSMRNMLIQAGYEILDVKGIPAPFPKALRSKFLGNILVKLNDLLIKFSKSLFAYQMFFKIKPSPTVENVLKETISYSERRKEDIHVASACQNFQTSEYNDV